jgi:NAD(P) transhydrogenase subunit alpha
MVVAITFFIFALLLGVAVIGRVPATLHTPLMSGANSIHGVVVVGVIIIAAQVDSMLSFILVFFAALLGTLNVVGGYVVTDRMLEMFKPKKEVSEIEAELHQQADDQGGIEVNVLESVEVPVNNVNITEVPGLEKSVVVDNPEEKGAVL